MKKRIFTICIALVAMCLMVGCGNKIKTNTVYFSTLAAPEKDYYVLEKDGKYVANVGLNGTYEIDGDKISFKEAYGNLSEGYFIKDMTYMLIDPYDEYEDKIPGEDTFEIICRDGRSTSMTFHKDGSVERYLYIPNYMDMQSIGTYVRSGDLISCTFPDSTGAKAVQIYGIRNGVLYDCYSSNLDDFGNNGNLKTIIASHTSDDISIIVVIVVVILAIAIFGVIVYMIYAAGKNKKKR